MPPVGGAAGGWLAARPPIPAGWSPAPGGRPVRPPPETVAHGLGQHAFQVYFLKMTNRLF